MFSDCVLVAKFSNFRNVAIRLGIVIELRSDFKTVRAANTPGCALDENVDDVFSSGSGVGRSWVISIGPLLHTPYIEPQIRDPMYIPGQNTSRLDKNTNFYWVAIGQE